MKTIKDINIDNKKVIIRVDFNVPLKDGIVKDENRVKEAIPTIKYLVDNDVRIWNEWPFEAYKNSEEYLSNLNENTRLMRNLLNDAGLNVVDGETPIIPIIIGPAELANRFSKKLEKEGILVSSIRPPSVPKGESRLRLTIIATHTREEIKSTANTIIKIANELKK